LKQWNEFTEQLEDAVPLDRPIHVAILDDGFDVTHPNLKNNMVGGYSCEPNDPQGRIIGVAVPEPTHGTKVAYLVTKSCPQVKIIPIRLEQRDGSGRPRPTIRSVAKVRYS